MNFARPSEAGMTLIEMLVVLAIIGVMAGAMSLGMGGASREEGLQAEATRLARRVQWAADGAMSGDRPVALVWDAHGYAFLTWNGDHWVADDDEGFARHRLPGDLTLLLTPKRQPLPVVMGGAPILARLDGKGRGWIVVYDGLNATATPS